MMTTATGGAARRTDLEVVLVNSMIARQERSIAMAVMST